MLLERVYDPDLAHASYLIGCQAEGSAIVIDPRRDGSVSLELAAKNSLRITPVTATHIHADHPSGARERAAATRPARHLPVDGGSHWRHRVAPLPRRHG